MNVAIVYIYSTSFQKVDEEEYGGMSEILKEGLMTSFSSFLVCVYLFLSFFAFGLDGRLTHLSHASYVWDAV